jgi:peptidoglycan-N-acetylmuramic acid deacetylase
MIGKKTKPDPSNTPADLKRLSWYYLKHGKGKVPNFPPETKTFAANGEKAVWVGSGKSVYLTFDNGGPMGDTAKLLKTLDDNYVKATFFIAGYNLKAHPDFFKRLVADGQLIGNHSMTHTDFNKLTDDQAKKEIKEFETLYHKITGQEPAKIFRFPYGTYSKYKLKLVSDLGYTSVFWSTAMKDWVPRKNGTTDTYKDIMGNLHDGDIILMHQGSDDNIAALDSIIKAIKKEGYEFKLITNQTAVGH